MSKYIVDGCAWQELCNEIPCSACNFSKDGLCSLELYIKNQPVYEEKPKKVENGMNRLETEIENHRIRAIVSGNVGNVNESNNEWFLFDCLSALKNLHETGNCNNCTHKDCGYLPEVGKLVRYNCPFYKKEEEEEEEETETWNGFHGQLEVPKGTFDKIWNDEEGDA